MNWDIHSLTSSDDGGLDGVEVGVGDEGVFLSITFVSSNTRTFRKAAFPSRARMIRIKRNVHHLNLLFSCFFWGGECLGTG